MLRNVKQLRAKLLDMARSDVRKRNWGSAARRYRRLTGLEPDNPNFYLKLGDVSQRTKNTGEAVQAYLEAAALFGRDGFDEKAVAVYRQVLELDPTRYAVFATIAETYERLGRTGDAVESLTIAANKLQMEGETDEALRYRKIIARLEPADTASRLTLAQDLQEGGLADDSLSEQVEVAVEYARQPAPERIREILETIVSLKPKDIAALKELSESPSEAGEDGDSREVEDLLAKLQNCRGYQDALLDLYRRVAQEYRQRVGVES